MAKLGRGLRRELLASASAFFTALGAPGLRKIVLAFCLAAATEATTWLAIGVYAYARGGATEVGVVGFALLLPAAIMAPIAATLGDRHRRQRVLLAAYVVQLCGVAAAAIARRIGAPAVVVYAFTMLTTLAITPIRPSQGALLPSISLAPADVAAANIALTTARNLGLVGGPLLAGLLLHAGGPADVFAACVILLFVGTLLIAFVPTDRRRDRSDHRALHQVIEGARLLFHEDRGTLVVGLTFAKHIVMGALRAFLVIVALGLLGMGSGGPGALSVALGVGGAVGAGTTVVLMGRRRLSPALVLGAMLLGLPVVAIAAWPRVGLALLALAVAGTGRSLIDIAGRTLLGRVSPEEALARFLGMLEGSSYAGLAIGSGLAALLVHLFGIRSARVVTGLFLPVVVLVLLKPLTSIDRSPLVSRDRLELILGVPMFAPLPPESVERLALLLQPVIVERGASFIRQGDVGDRFFILESGGAHAFADGVIVATYERGGSFGEIALLRDVPRTATVTATIPSRAMALDRAHFLAVLTEEPAGLRAAEQVADTRIEDTESKRT